MAIFNETEIATIEYGDLWDAWTDMGDARDHGKALIIVNHEELAPVLNVWQSMGLFVRNISVASADASIIFFSGAFPEYTHLAVPFALTSIANLGLYCALWKTRIFYKFFQPAYLIDSFLKTVGTSNILKMPYVSISNEWRERHELVAHSILSGVAFVLASVGRDKVDSVIDRFVEWGKNTFGGMKKLEDAATEESG